MTHQNFRQTSSWRAKSLLIGVVGLLAVLIMPAHSLAAGQGFSVLNGAPQNGMLMSLTTNPKVVERANENNAEALVGVVAPNTSNFQEQPGQTNVETDGAANTLVSTAAGNINSGDRITVSSLDGVGAKANASGWIVGIAQADFNSHTTGAIATIVTNSKGKPQTVFVGNIPLVIKVSYYSTTPASSQAAASSSTIQQAANSLAGKHVSVLALILSFLLFLVVLIVVGSIIVTTVWGSFAAISRQPLTKFTVRRQEIRSFAIATVVLISGSIAAWVLLKAL